MSTSVGLGSRDFPIASISDLTASEFIPPICLRINLPISASLFSKQTSVIDHQSFHPAFAVLGVLFEFNVRQYTSSKRNSCLSPSVRSALQATGVLIPAGIAITTNGFPSLSGK